jgi:hypothetical protein
MEESMKVLRYRAHNVLRTKDIDWNMDGYNLFIVGGHNGQGKTSGLKALVMALCGRSGCDWPEVALKEGEDEGWVKVDIGPTEGDDTTSKLADGFQVELYLKRKRDGQVVEQFRVLDKDGEELPSPRKLLQRLYVVKGFDPLAFQRMDKKEQKAVLERLLCVDLTEKRTSYEALYRQRQVATRDAKNLRARYEGMPHHPGVPDSVVSVSDLLKELDSRKAVKEANDDQRKVLCRMMEDITEHKAKLTEIDERMEALEAEKKKLLEDEAEIDRYLDEAFANKENQESVVTALVDPDQAEVLKQIETAEATNAKVRDNMAKKTLFGELHELENGVDELNKEMEANQKAQKAALEAAKWPVDGLSLDSEGVLFNALPLEQASRSARTIVSAKIGMALNPRLRLMVCEDGSDLDAETLEALDKLMAEEKYQMILELVTRGKEDEARCAVIVQDGTSFLDSEKSSESSETGVDIPAVE